MSPIERVRAKAQASEILGVGVHAGPEELRAAWRRMARSLHPDQMAGDSRRFMNARAAYDLLADIAGPAAEVPDDLDSAPVRKTAMRRAPIVRPAVPTRTLSLGDEVREICEAHLKTQAESAAADHVPEQVTRSGRALTFKVSTPLRKGVNRVAVPTDLFQTRRVSRPTILKFVAASSGSGEIVVPEGILQQRFPGARQVRLLFACQ
ncbi:DnaJ domain-containing protein [Tropicimonas sp. IMCC6043]|uniref:DnaJ domain-containing protein n=1 Tax=Tropicimonas sp. IMCC6043 TaxID=2510645 RepID=UPI00101DAD9B|nr:DnaJ domain-containing protein [Tropicimonas sp. IMCC6043]RYH12111.1 hypothetical protein EU800_00650 [Tropicimonas sp. IMCC6043]